MSWSRQSCSVAIGKEAQGYVAEHIACDLQHSNDSPDTVGEIDILYRDLSSHDATGVLQRLHSEVRARRFYSPVILPDVPLVTAKRTILIGEVAALPCVSNVDDSKLRSTSPMWTLDKKLRQIEVSLHHLKQLGLERDATSWADLLLHPDELSVIALVIIASIAPLDRPVNPGVELARLGTRYPRVAALSAPGRLFLRIEPTVVSHLYGSFIHGPHSANLRLDNLEQSLGQLIKSLAQLLS